MEEWQLDQLKWYLSLPKTIELMERKVQVVSSNYYATHSLVGCSCRLLDSEAYQLNFSVMWHVMEIIGEEKSLMIQINKLKRRLKALTEELTIDEQHKLRLDLFADLDLLKKACDWMIELEYYFNSNAEGANEDIFIPSEELLKKLDQQEEELFEMFGV
ncbi:hypothetical protein [Globicatella sanguinis]|uniref:hypothetical protein n=1 Tax=Globicatella sanguinis TaxID=13076 RepID=UPI0025439251|nr:hypothetical protein [Globicatella sanguinis]MDK7631607.1 hypothetical protein [Globicatella sanguinis]WIK66441.1 hypothetical protein CYJ72_011080 [Globicatella sanguinis]WKT55846.1 hypothetical protein Q3C38_11080 [Globicatella sanguinis]